MTLLAALAWVWFRGPFTSQARHLWALTSIVAVLVDPHLVDYDLAVLIPAAIFLAILVPALRWTIVAMYPLSLFRMSPVVGDVVVQVTVIVLLWWAVVLFRELRTFGIQSQDASALQAGSNVSPGCRRLRYWCSRRRRSVALSQCMLLTTVAAAASPRNAAAGRTNRPLCQKYGR